VWFGVFSIMELIRMALARVMTSTRPVGWLITAYAAGYMALAFRKVYGESLLKSIAKAAFVMVAYGMALVAAIVGVALAAR
jgi:hypothetical protein